MAGRQFQVNKGCTIKDISIKAGGSGKLFAAGTVLEQGHPPIKTSKQVDALMHSRHIVEYYPPRTEEEVIKPDQFSENPPGTEDQKPLALADNKEREGAVDSSQAPVLSGQGGDGVEAMQGGPANIAAHTPAPTPSEPGVDGDSGKVAMQDPVTVTQTNEAGPRTDSAGSPVSLWVLDPTTLQGKGLEELGAMVIERDATMAVPQTVEEAVAVLTRDWKPATA